MPITFLGQPFSTETQIGTALREGLADETYDRLWLASAWAKRSGLNRVRRAILEFRNRGGDTEAIVGIDEGGATKEGLEACLELFARCWVLKDRGGRTFHPKVYALEGSGRARILVGSGNLTRGGLFTNYEAALQLDLSSEDAGEWELRNSIREYYDKLLGLTGATLTLDQDLVDLLAGEGRVLSEAVINQRRARSSGSAATSLFVTVPGLAAAPPAEAPELDEEAADEDAAIETLPEPATAEVERERDAEETHAEDSQDELPGMAGGTLGFWKTLSASDASRTSSPGQIIIPRRFLDFFPALAIEFDNSATGGPRQSNAHFAVDFRDGQYAKRVTDARVVLYEPAAYHPRPNVEVRFTFRDQEVFSRLSEDDILIFRRANGQIEVERRPPGSMGVTARFGALP